MRKKMAMMMAFVLAVGALPPLNIKATTVIAPQSIVLEELSTGSSAKHIAYSESKKKFELVNLSKPNDTEIVAMSFAIGKNDMINQGTYTLDYYLQDPMQAEDDDTNRIQVTFYVGKKFDAANNLVEDTKTIGVAVHTYGVGDPEGTTPLEMAYQQYSAPPYTEGGAIEVAHTFTHNISMDNTVEPKEKELKVRIGQYSPIVMYYENNAINVGIDDVAKGNVTPITLAYQSVQATQPLQVGGFVAFKGLSAFEVAPTHLVTPEEIAKLAPNYLSDDAIQSQKVIPIEQLEDAELDEIPGGRPGVVVKFDRPRVIDEKTGDFVFIDEVGEVADDTYAKLLLMKEYSNEQDSATERTYAVEFGFTENSKAIVQDKEGAVADGEVMINEAKDKFELYFSAKDYGYDEVHVWQGLEAGMILKGHMDFEGHYFDGSYFETPLAPVYDVSNKGVDTAKSGNTYMWYNVKRTDTNTVTFEIDPYDITTGKITYNLFREAGIPSTTNKLVPIEIRHYEAEDLTNRIYMATDMIDGRRYYLMNIQINGGGNDFTTQIVAYDPGGSPIPAPYPEIKSFDNIYVVANPESDKQHIPNTVGTDITWYVPDDLGGYLNNGNAIYYELFLSDKEAEDYIPTKVFKVYKDPDAIDESEADILVEVHAGSQEGEVATYDPVANTITVENIVLKQPGSSKWEGLVFTPGNGGYLAAPTYPTVQDEGVNPGIYVDTEHKVYEIPDTFYFKMRSVYENKQTNALGESIKLADSSYSKVEAIALDITKEVLPTINKQFTAEDTSKEGSYSGAIYFEAVDLKNYVSYMMTPSEVYLSDEGAAAYKEDRYKRYYELYLSKSGSASTGQEIISVTVDGTTIDVAAIEMAQMDFSGVNLDALGLTEEDIERGNVAVQDLLREGKIALKFRLERDKNEGLEQLTVNGLDGNTPYYVRGRVAIERWKQEADGYRELTGVQSIYSRYVTFTTATIATPPTTDEKYPPAPSAFGVKEDLEGPIVPPTSTAENPITLYWEAPTFMDVENLYYEILRSDGQAMSADHDKREVSMAELVAFQEATQDLEETWHYNYRLYRTGDIDGIKEHVEYYDDKGKAWKETTQQIDTDQNKVEDDTLTPNQVYYYYIRTVYAIEGQELRSEWIMIPVTTTTLGIPVQLQVEPSKKEAYGVYDTTEEMIITFLAPIPKGYGVGETKDYTFDIAIKGEEDEQYYIANETAGERDYKAGSMEEITINSTTYRKFKYKISGLDHATSYSIKVRIEDRTKGTDAIVYSLYSDVVRARTDFDEEKDEEDTAFQKYLEIYEREANKLRNQPAWPVDAASNTSSYKYRANYFLEELGTTNNYQIVLEDGVTRGYYYFPLQTFEVTADKGTMIEIVGEGYTVHMRDEVLEQHDTIVETYDLIESGEIEDAYVAVEVAQNRTSKSIYGHKPLSDQITITMEVVLVEEKDFMVEDSIIDALADLIDDGRLGVIDELEKNIDKGKIADEDLDKIIADEIAWIRQRHKKEVEAILDDITDDITVIETIEEPLLLTAAIDAFNVNGYYETASSKWESVQAFQTGGGYAMELKLLGTYVFVGNEGTTSLVPHIPGAADLISKYNLTDFFQVDAEGLSGYLTKQQMYGAVARLVGARRGTDYTIALQNRGIKLVMPQNIYQTVRQDETIYLVMQAYEKLYYKPIESIYIQNKQRVQNIAAFQPQYQPYVHAAVQLAVVTPVGGRVNPSEAVTVEAFLGMLVKIMPR